MGITLGNNIPTTISGDHTFTGNITINGNLFVLAGGATTIFDIVSGSTIIDVDSAEAFLVRKDGDAGDVFTIDTSGDNILFPQSGTVLNFNSGDATITHSSGTLTFGAVNYTFTETASTSGTPTGFLYSAAAHTGLTASTEYTSVNFNLAGFLDFDTGNIITMRAYRLQVPTYRFGGASTIDTCVGVDFPGFPQGGTNCSITNHIGLRFPANSAQGSTLTTVWEVGCPIVNLASPTTIAGITMFNNVGSIALGPNAGTITN